MKKVTALILIALLILLSGCNSATSKICYACNESCSQEVKFCPNCGANLISSDDEFNFEIDSEPIDYGDFGFENTYGLTEWISITEYDFSDINNAYIEVSYRGHEVFLFENGYLQSRYFKEANYYSGDFSKGDLDTAMRYSVVSNSVLSMDDNSTYEITNISMKGNVPIIHTDHTLYRNMGTFITDGIFIPTQFIDFSKEPEIVEDHRYITPSLHVRYYIKTEYLEELQVE